VSKDIPYEKLIIGEQLGPREIPTADKDIDRYINEMGDLNPIYTDSSPWGGPVIPAMYMGTLLGLRLIGTKYDAHTTVPVRLSQKNINPAKRGKKLFLSGVLVDKYIKRGLEYAVIESVIKDEDGLEIRKTTDHFLLSLERRQDIVDRKG
jgi:hypothetical protein